jgi:hypothetical protein
MENCSVNRAVYPVKLACHPERISWPQKILSGLVLVRMTDSLGAAEPFSSFVVPEACDLIRIRA